ncbi:MAG: chemotaxis protein CheB [Pirellulales bacterium]
MDFTDTSHSSPTSPTEGADTAVRYEGDKFYVVAIGASAGGLEALEKFFDNVPPDGGLAFVVVQHLSPDFRSLMDELLARHTELAIHRVEDGMQIEPNAIYLIPPKKEMIVSGGRLLLTDKDPTTGLSLPVDTFMRSLAQDVGDRAIGVVLSGTGSDGSRGIRAIHDVGGFVMAQDETSANFDGMPRSAVDTGIVDAVLPPQSMPTAIMNHIQGNLSAGGVAATLESVDDSSIGELFRALREAYGIDFSYYKPTTVARRVERRLQLSGTYKLSDYVTHAREDAEELNSLYRDLLIGVTKFFRDEEAFKHLENEIIPQLLARVPAEDEIRVWVAGCATGEEAYSLAILIYEALEARKRPINAKIFATDVHQASLEFASTGLFSEQAIEEVSRDRFERFFVRQGNKYQVAPHLRKMIVFAPHNVVRDAPFTKLDLISCRNLLIYFQPDAQKKALSLFHFGLKASGVLFLGPSESPGELSDEFDAVDRHWKIFRKRRDVRLTANVRLPLSPGLERLRANAASAGKHPHNVPDIQLLRAYNVLLEEYAPPTLLLDERRHLVHSFGGAGRLLAMPDGRPPDDVLDLVDNDLKLALAGALQRVAKEKQPVVYGSVKTKRLPGDQHVRLTVRPVTVHTTGEEFYLVSMESRSAQASERVSEAEVDFQVESRARLNDVEEELRYTKENLQATVEEMETTNEELQATNEELVASNEELQSTNEELHSVNEELYTVNAEHQRKITELTQLTEDMDNLLRSIDIGVIFLDDHLCIRKYTPKITGTFNILPQDVGRSLDTFSHGLEHHSLLEDVHRVLERHQPIEREVRDRRGTWLLLRIMPYEAKESVEGVVIALVDINNLKSTEEQLKRMSKVFMDGADPIIIEDLDGRIVDLNREAEQIYGWSRDELLGKQITVLVPDEHIEEAEKIRRRCRNHESVRNIETFRKNKSGRHVPSC